MNYNDYDSDNDNNDNDNHINDNDNDNDYDYVLKKYIKIESINNNIVVNINEFFTNKCQSIFCWPSSYVLASYIVAAGARKFKDKRIVEIGAGTGLPSLVAASNLIQARSCLLTERVDEPRVLKNLDMNIRINKVESVCRTMPLSWGIITDPSICRQLECDYIFAADVFYSTEDFNSIFLTISSIMNLNENTIFLTTYQERSIKRTIKPFLDFYNMDAKLITRSKFLHPAHQESQLIVNHNTSSKRKRSVDNNDEMELQSIPIPSYDNIYLIKVSLRK